MQVLSSLFPGKLSSWRFRIATSSGPPSGKVIFSRGFSRLVSSHSNDGDCSPENETGKNQLKKGSNDLSKTFACGMKTYSVQRLEQQVVAYEGKKQREKQKENKPLGFEPTTCWSLGLCSTAEQQSSLHHLVVWLLSKGWKKSKWWYFGLKRTVL